MSVSGTMGGGVGIGAAKNGRRQLGQSSVRASKERSYWCTWQQDGQAVQNAGACDASASCCRSGGGCGLAARGGRPRFAGGVAEAACRGWGAGGDEAGRGGGGG